MTSSHKSVPELQEELKALKNDRNRILVDFLLTDLDLSLTFVKMALNQIQDEEKRERHRINARKGYEAVLHLKDRFEMPTSQQQDVMAKLEKLRSALEEAGERFED